jgi:predicted DNA-binding transcriptional regulator AlpA
VAVGVVVMDDTKPAKKTTDEKIRMCISYLQKHGYQVIFPKYGKESAQVQKLVENQRDQMLKMGGASAASLINSAEVAALIGVHRDTIKRWVDEDKFPKPIIGGGVFGGGLPQRWRLCDVTAFVELKANTPATP